MGLRAIITEEHFPSRNSPTDFSTKIVAFELTRTTREIFDASHQLSRLYFRTPEGLLMDDGKFALSRPPGPRRLRCRLCRSVGEPRLARRYRACAYRPRSPHSSRRS